MNPERCHCGECRQEDQFATKEQSENAAAVLKSIPQPLTNWIPYTLPNHDKCVYRRIGARIECCGERINQGIFSKDPDYYLPEFLMLSRFHQQPEVMHIDNCFSFSGATIEQWFNEDPQKYAWDAVAHFARSQPCLCVRCQPTASSELVSETYRLREAVKAAIEVAYDPSKQPAMVLTLLDLGFIKIRDGKEFPILEE
jgi:hypothetical protein